MERVGACGAELPVQRNLKGERAKGETRRGGGKKKKKKKKKPLPRVVVVVEEEEGLSFSFLAERLA